MENEVLTSQTEAQKKLDFLLFKIQSSIETHARKRVANKQKAFRFKMIATALSGAITVLAGISISGTYTIIANIIILFLGALITFFTTWDTFYNHKELWVKYTDMVIKLSNLKIKTEYLSFDNQKELTIQQVDLLMDEYIRLLNENGEQWQMLRKTKKEEERKA
jgi:hypothetical protein